MNFRHPVLSKAPQEHCKEGIIFYPFLFYTSIFLFQFPFLSSLNYYKQIVNHIHVITLSTKVSNRIVMGVRRLHPYWDEMSTLLTVSLSKSLNRFQVSSPPFEIILVRRKNREIVPVGRRERLRFRQTTVFRSRGDGVQVGPTRSVDQTSSKVQTNCFVSFLSVRSVSHSMSRKTLFPKI